MEASAVWGAKPEIKHITLAPDKSYLSVAIACSRAPGWRRLGCFQRDLCRLQLLCGRRSTLPPVSWLWGLPARCALQLLAARLACRRLLCLEQLLRQRNTGIHKLLHSMPGCSPHELFGPCWKPCLNQWYGLGVHAARLSPACRPLSTPEGASPAGACWRLHADVS